MNARSLLVALFCVSCVVAYGPLFIMSKKGDDEQYYGSNMTEEDVEAIIKEKEMTPVRIIFNATEETPVTAIQSYVEGFKTRIIVPHFIGNLNATESTVVSSLEELRRVPVYGKLVVVEMRQGEEYIAPPKAVLDSENRGVYMTPSVMMALIVVITLSYGLYIAVKCIDEVQTPTAYTHDALAVGKEF